MPQTHPVLFFTGTVLVLVFLVAIFLWTVSNISDQGRRNNGYGPHVGKTQDQINQLKKIDEVIEILEQQKKKF